MSDDAPELLNFIDGDFHPSASDHWIDDLAPATGRLIARIPCSDSTDIDPAAVGLTLQAMISVSLQSNARGRIRDFIACTHPQKADVVADYVAAMDNPDCTLLDTRKTIPGLRLLEKYAVRMGGAANHRMGLWDAAMIKDNHVLVAGSVGEAVRRAVAAGVEEIICEVDRIDQIGPALDAGATRLLLDNMEPDTLREAVALVAGRVPTEASGGINLDTIRAKAATGVDYVSVGRLTQSAPAADIGLDFTTLA